MSDRTELPWQRSAHQDAPNPSRCCLAGWAVGVFRDDRGNLLAKLWRPTGRRGLEKHYRLVFDSVTDAEVWCERLFAFLANGAGAACVQCQNPGRVSGTFLCRGCTGDNGN